MGSRPEAVVTQTKIARLLTMRAVNSWPKFVRNKSDNLLNVGILCSIRFCQCDRSLIRRRHQTNDGTVYWVHHNGMEWSVCLLESIFTRTCVLVYCREIKSQLKSFFILTDSIRRNNLFLQASIASAQNVRSLPTENVFVLILLIHKI